MFCKNCGNEIDNDNNFCPNCGLDLSADKHDLCGVTKISTPLFILFSILTLGIYYLVKMYRITKDLKKIIPRIQSVSYAVITVLVILQIFDTTLSVWGDYLRNLATNIMKINVNGDVLTALSSFDLLLSYCSIFLGITRIILYCDVIYKTLNNIKYIARQKQNKLLKYNKFWAFAFGFTYINFVINTYDKRLCNIYVQKRSL